MRKDDPSGREIAEKAKQIKFDNRKDIVGEKNGKTMHFLGADLSHVKSLDELEDGQVIGVMDTALAGDETTLPAGKHNLFLSKVGGEWRIHAESNGEIVAQAVRVSVAEHAVSTRRVSNPHFSQQGWCLIDICILSIWGCCVLYIALFCF
jgi:hypothetical protein